jgi:hypothetical protein
MPRTVCTTFLCIVLQFLLRWERDATVREFIKNTTHWPLYKEKKTLVLNWSRNKSLLCEKRGTSSKTFPEGIAKDLEQKILIPSQC